MEGPKTMPDSPTDRAFQALLDLVRKPKGRESLEEVILRLVDAEPFLVLTIPQMITSSLFVKFDKERLKVADFAHNTMAMMTPAFAKDPSLRARALRDILASHQYRGAAIEKALRAELDELMKDPDTVRYLEMFPYGRRE